MGDFRKRVDASRSRANSLRPMHSTLRQFYAYSFVCFLSLATMTLTHGLTRRRNEAPADSVEVYGAMIVGSGLALVALLALVHLLTDALRVVTIRKMSRREFRRRLWRERKRYRYAADPIQLKSMRLGAIFFGALALLGTLRLIVFGDA